MKELTNSILSAPLNAVEQLTDSLGLSKSDKSEGTQGQISELLQAFYQAAGTMQKDLIDAGYRLFGPESWTPSGFARTAAEMTSRMADGMRFLDPSSEGLAAWREIWNKLEIYRLVKDIKSKVNIPDGRFDLHEYVDKCYSLGPFQALWAVEGLGHDYAHSFRPYTENTTGILTDSALDDIPLKSMTMLNAGIGLGFAQELLKDLNSSTPASEIHTMLELYLRLCRQNARPGYEGAALESLGLVTRTWHEELMTAVDEQLRSIDEAAAAYFWRGAGRALYFLPANFVPMYGSIANAIRMSRRESSHELARRNTLAGIAWASTVVNMEEPEIMEAFLRQHGDDLFGQDAFANGVASSIVMRLDTTPNEPFIKEFIEYRVDESNSRLAELWEIHVRVPGERALRDYHPVLSAHNRLGEVFRYQSLSKLVDELEG